MFSYQTGKHNNRGSTNSNRQKSYSNNNPREYKHPNYKHYPQNKKMQGPPQHSQFQFGYGDREFQRHSQHDDHQYQNVQHQDRDKRFERNSGLNEERPRPLNVSVATANNDTKFYTCPGCNSQFDYRNRFGRYTGKLPLILNCKHTVCQECIHKGAVDDNIVCPICKNPSALIDKNYMDNLYEAFSPNYYIFGMISFSKGSTYNSDRLNLVPVQESRKNNFVSLTEKQQEIGQRCCFLSCHNEANLRCEDCNDVYCTDCSTVIHKSAKSLWTHKQVSITLKKPTRELERCTLHEMDIEFFCKDCEEGSCCYCFIDKHAGHEKDDLSKLSAEDMINLEANKQKAKQIFKQLLMSQRRIRDLHSSTASASEKKICSYFVNLHAKIHSIEKNLRKDVVSFHDVGTTSQVVDGIISSINNSIDHIKNLLVDCDCLNTKKLNLKRLKEELENSLSTPCYLLSENNKSLEPVQFKVDPILDKIEECFHISNVNTAGFTLVSEDQLPPDYEKDPEELQYESDVESCLGSIYSSGQPEGQKRKNTKLKVSTGKTFERILGKSEKFDNELVEVTHIESLECFYVQLKRLQFNLRQMNKDINNYVKLAGMVIRPQLNELYLAQYITKTEKMWCRGRLVEIKNGETEPLYEIFFVDYGSTQTLDITKLREITSLIAQPKPFAIQCELYNPTYASWRKHAHVYMGKMINGKDVYMLLKDKKNCIFMVDLMVSSSDGGLTSLIDILIHTCSDSLNRSGDESTSSQMSPFVPEHKIYGNSQEFKKNQTENVTIAKIIDPHHIFIHIAVHAESIKKMINSLRLEYRNSSNHGCIPIEGTYVVVEHKDPIRGNWHRALIKKVYINNERVNVLLVDWGANITVPWSSVRMLKENFTKLECQAILVKLAHIEPHESTMVWSENASLFLQRFFQSQEVLKMIVHNVEPLEVALFEPLNNMDICINALLVKKKYAESTGKISETVEWPKNFQQPEGFKKEDGFVAGLLEKVEESDDDDDSDNEDKSVVKQKVDIMKIVSPDLIYIKFVCQEHQEQAMHKELQIHYYKDRKTKASWKPGEDCVVNYTNCYTRGKILSVEENNKYRVNLYDRVEEVVLPLLDIFTYTKYFKKYSSFVYKSHLANIKPAGGEKWSMSSIEALERIFDKYKDIYATKVQGNTTSKSFPMHMWYTRIIVGGALEANMVKFISINNKLMKLGFASKQLVKTEFVPQPSTSADAASKLLESLCLLPDDSTSSEIDSTTHIESTEVGTIIGEASCDDKDLSANSEKFNSSISTDWNELIDEEENKNGDSHIGHVEEEIQDWLPAFPIDKKEFNAWITCAETEGILYLRIGSLQQVYKEMENNINENFKKKSRKPDLSYKWEAGDLCTIHYKGSYYRGKIYKVTPECITAVMIDFGSDHELKPKDLYREILYPKIPAFASKVKLDKVYAKSGKWLSSDYENLLDIVTEYGKVIINGSLDVEIPLAEIFTDTGMNVNQALVQKCPNLTRSQQLEESMDDDVVIEKEESVVYDTEIGEIKEKTTNEIDALIPFKFESLPENCTEEKFNMSVVWVLTYNTVVIRKPIVNEDEDHLYLYEQMQKLWKDQPVLDKIDIGMACIALYSEDGIWYRAQVYNINGLDCGFVFVIFVDFGNVESVTVKDLRQMRPEWFEFTVPCHIATINVELKTDNHVEYVFQHMRKIHGKDKLVKVVSKNPLIIHIFDDNSEFAYQTLIDNGLLKVKSD